MCREKEWCWEMAARQTRAQVLGHEWYRMIISAILNRDIDIEDNLACHRLHSSSTNLRLRFINPIVAPIL
jgi:hypothetical protein